MQAAAKCYTEKGVAKTSIQDVTVRAKVSRSTFYQYFSSKEDLRNAVLKHCKDTLFETMSEELLPTIKNLRQLFEEAVVFASTFQCSSLAPSHHGVKSNTDLMMIVSFEMPDEWQRDWVDFFDRGCRFHAGTDPQPGDLEEIASLANRLVMVYRLSGESESGIRSNLRIFNSLLSRGSAA